MSAQSTFDRTVKTVRSLIDEFTFYYPGNKIVMGSGLRPYESSDHGDGYAIDLNSVVPVDLVRFFMFWRKKYQSAGVSKMFLSIHNRHVHLSCRPNVPSILGFEDYNGGNIRDPKSYPIPRYNENFTLSDHEIQKVLSLYQITFDDLKKLRGDNTNFTASNSSGCGIWCLFFFLLPFGGFLLWLM